MSVSSDKVDIRFIGDSEALKTSRRPTEELRAALRPPLTGEADAAAMSPFSFRSWSGSLKDRRSGDDAAEAKNGAFLTLAWHRGAGDPQVSFRRRPREQTSRPRRAEATPRSGESRGNLLSWWPRPG